MITPFRIDIGDDVLDDLRLRIARARLLPESPGRPWSALPADYLAELADDWRSLDWTARQEWLNSFPQFTTTIDTAHVHFVHRIGSDTEAPPVLLMHGWPHTFALQLALVEAAPELTFVVPSLPGFAFSSPYEGPISERRLAETMHSLMTSVLGYDGFITYGEDLTANVNDLLAATHPESVAGMLATHAHFPTAAEREELNDPQTDAFFARLAADMHDMAGYAHLQSTRPDTLAAALNDSPVGLLAWIVEKLIEWSDTPPDDPRAVEKLLSRERMLTEATIYWATQSIATSFRPYFDRDYGADIPPVEVPASVHIQRHEHDYPEAAARAFYRDLFAFERLERGGHFAAAEVPGVIADRLRALVARVR